VAGPVRSSEPDLFAAAASERIAARAPLADRLRPVRLDDIVGQDDLLAPGKPLRVLIEADRLSSVILWGPPGTGKTTLARVIARSTSKEFEALSAVSATVKDVREVQAKATQRLGERGQGTILFLDEVHRFTKSQQDALLPSVEDGLLVLIGATTENPYFEVNPPLLSRSTLFRLQPLSADAVRTLIVRALDAEGADGDDDAVEHLVERAGGDGRHVLTSLEVAVALATERAAATGHAGRPRMALADAEAALGTKAMRYGRDDHYDVISAFIKSIRGSDPDAGLYWLAVMLEAGEDARFIARRLVILASEDVGMADPMSLLVANAAAHAVEYVGLPEAQLNLAQAVVHLATAPKSNRSALGIWHARGDVAAGGASEVPAHLRDAHYRAAASLGHGDGYDYPHDHADGWVPQQYLPDEVADRRYYEPSAHGHESEITERMRRFHTPIDPADEDTE
jgi:putative ATPase